MRVNTRGCSRVFSLASQLLNSSFYGQPGEEGDMGYIATLVKNSFSIVFFLPII